MAAEAAVPATEDRPEAEAQDRLGKAVLEMAREEVPAEADKPEAEARDRPEVS